MRSGWLRILVAALSLIALSTLSGLVRAQDKVIRWATNPNDPSCDWATDDQHPAGTASELLALIAPSSYDEGMAWLAQAARGTRRLKTSRQSATLTPRPSRPAGDGARGAPRVLC